MIEKETERERKDKWRKRSKEKHSDEKDADKLAYPLTPDRTSVETHYNRSRKIRLTIYQSLIWWSKSNRSFADISDLGNQIANDARCSYETSMRWVKQYTSLNGDFYLFDDDRRVAYKRIV